MEFQSSEISKLRLFFTEMSYIAAVGKGVIPGKAVEAEALSRMIDDELKNLGADIREKLGVDLMFQDGAR